MIAPSVGPAPLRNTIRGSAAIVGAGRSAVGRVPGRTPLAGDYGARPEGTEAEPAPTDKYIEILHNRTLT